MPYFYCEEVNDGLAILSESESHHCMHVLRRKVGNEIQFFDGKGHFYIGKIQEYKKKICSVNVISMEEIPRKRDYNVHIAIGPPRNMDRFEWFLEKCTEIGIDEITPLVAKHSERKFVRTERMMKVLKAALKQSKCGYLPQINKMVPFHVFMDELSDLESQRFIASYDPENKNLKDDYKAGKDVIIMIGPEGDFSETELDYALKNGFVKTNLSENRLRTETAGILACATIHLMN